MLDVLLTVVLADDVLKKANSLAPQLRLQWKFGLQQDRDYISCPCTSTSRRIE